MESFSSSFKKAILLLPRCLHDKNVTTSSKVKDLYTHLPFSLHSYSKINCQERCNHVKLFSSFTLILLHCFCFFFAFQTCTTQGKYCNHEKIRLWDFDAFLRFESLPILFILFLRWCIYVCMYVCVCVWVGVSACEWTW